MREICEPHKVEQAVAAVMNADEERVRIARIKYCTRLERTPWKTFLCCALGRKHACEYIDDFPHIIEVLLYQERRAGRELYDFGMYGYKSDEYALTDWMVNPSARSLQDPGRMIDPSGDTVESLRNNERAQQPIEEVSLNPKRQLRAYVALIGVALFAVALAPTPGVAGLAAYSVRRVTDFAAAFGLTEANVRWFARVVVVGGTMGIAGAVYCALTFGIATGVVFVLFKCRVPGIDKL
jgi:hypothetical protein